MRTGLKMGGAHWQTAWASHDDHDCNDDHAVNDHSHDPDDGDDDIHINSGRC